MARFRLITFILFWLFPCTGIRPYAPAAHAQEPTIYRLSLEDVSRLGLQNNFDIQIAQYEARIAQTDEDVATSIYDTMFHGAFDYRKDKSENASIILGSETVDHNYDVGLSQRLPTGTDVSVDLFNNRHFTDSPFLTSPLVHESTGALTVEQDLGKNFLGIQDRGAIKITGLEVDNKQYTSLEKIEGMLAQIQRAYWDLVLQHERVKIEEEMVAQAKRLYDLHREKLEVGVVEIPEAIAAEVNYEKRRNELELARRGQESAESVLKLMLNQTDEGVRLFPSQDLTVPPEEPALQESMLQAFNNRRDYKAAFNTIRARDIQLSMRRNDLWPEINLTASLARNGLGDHFDESLERTIDENNPDFFAGLEISFPLQNTKSRARLKAAELEKAKDIIGLKLIEKSIAVNVMDQVRNVHIYRRIAENNIRIAELEAQKLSAEEKQFNAGRSDTDTVIRFQEDVIEARLAAAQAQHRYQLALIDLRLDEASLLDSYWDEALNGL